MPLIRLKSLLIVTLFHLTFGYAAAQSASNKNAATIKLRLQKLNTLGSVLYFAAHPDDENTRLIAWLANEKYYRTGYLSLTRGDGGQNLIGTEQAEELGLLRTQELLAARQDDGGEQFFSTANDFGFSKTYAETFKIWNKEKILADAVWVIRNFKPDVIITRFPGDPRAGHGHHQASSILALEAFKAAADPNRFPEQLAYVKPWQAERILWNTFNFGSANTIEEGQFHVDLSQYNPFLGKTYGELAAISRTNHKSQGFGSTSQRGIMKEYFELLGGSSPRKSLFDGIDTTWSRVPKAQSVQKLIQQVNQEFDLAHPQYSVKTLVKLLSELEKLGDNYWAQQKIKEVKRLILDCANIWISCQTDEPKYANGETIQVNTHIIVQAPHITASLTDLRAGHYAGQNTLTSAQPLTYNQAKTLKTTIKTTDLTQPYWLSAFHSLGSFQVKNQKLIGMPITDNLPSMLLQLSIEGKIIDYRFPIIYAYNDPVKGEVNNPLIVAPRLTINLDQKAIIVNGNQPKQVELSFTANTDQVKAWVHPVLPKGWRMEPASFEVALQQKDDEWTKQVTIYPPAQASLNDSIYFNLVYPDSLKELAKAIHYIKYDHIPQIAWFPTTAARLSKIETGTAAKRIGYLPGAGDLIPQSLREIGLQVDLLSENDIMHQDLSVYDAIITGIRIYNVNDRIRYLQPKLLDYVKNGGTLVEQYNVNGGLKTPSIGPYPFQITRDRVTDEQAKVTFTHPQHQVLTYPNAISSKDFDGWIQERGLYFAGNVDAHYIQPLSMHDPDEAKNSGSLLVATYGKGKYVYTSLAFFRELPAGVPGAYRLFVNLLAKENK
ncbi:PIG-L family deacetylase [Olivibacter ginsenosidimutans]|uniref:PIG-L family deacetylase n=1 Tax=Olivibacter ginsenosidimutans TaxID=1176537 RepID=A0ABP9ALZ4_9SPHI